MSFPVQPPIKHHVLEITSSTGSAERDAECQEVLDDNWFEILTDQDHEALGAMLHAMRPRDDLKDES